MAGLIVLTIIFMVPDAWILIRQNTLASIIIIAAILVNLLVDFDRTKGKGAR